MKHFLNKGNIGIVFKRGFRDSVAPPIFISNKIIDFHSWSGPGSNVAPLYLYPVNHDQGDMFHTNRRVPNLDLALVEQIAAEIGLTFTPEKEGTENTFAPIDLLDYIYAVLHSPTYMEKYKEFLKIDFPRVPYPKDAATFWQLVNLGCELRQMHLLESPIVNLPITKYAIPGSNEVTKIKYEKGCVFINDTQYFEDVPVIAWEFYIGGYQPAQKWLKDRKDLKLSYDDILHYQKIIVALSQTDKLMKQIDKIQIE